MADYGSDIDEELLEEIAGEELEDPELAGEIDIALHAEVDYELINAPEDEEPEDPDLIGESIDLDDDSLEQKSIDPECNVIDDAPGETTINNSMCTKRDMIQFREMESAQNSRMPDIPTIFELGGLIISRACTLAANSAPLVPFELFDPAKIARRELIQGKALRAVMRNDTRWRWADFKYFPRGFMDENETADSLHEMH